MSIISFDGSGSESAGGVGVRGGYRLVTNRDEQRERAAAEPPTWRTIGTPGGAVRATYPIDPEGGGTWVAAVEGQGVCGLTLCLLNANPRPYPSLPPARLLRSRGAIIPELLERGARTALDVRSRLEGGVLDLERFAPFTLLATDLESATGRMRVVRARWDRSSLRLSTGGAGVVSGWVGGGGGGGVCDVSSGLGDDAVRDRLPLFGKCISGLLVGVSDLESVRRAQDAFHAHQWRARPEISVLMSRADARSVSRTIVESLVGVDGRVRVSMDYQPLSETAMPRPHLGVRRVGPASAVNC